MDEEMKEIKAQQRLIYERRRTALEALIQPQVRGNIKKFADETGIDATYVQRMLYPEGKKGRKNIGEEYVKLIGSKYPNWLDGETAPSFDEANKPQHTDAAWPFSSITPEEYFSLEEKQRTQIENRIQVYLDDNAIKSQEAAKQASN